MHCRSCRARLNEADNYCRKCGAAVEILDVEVVRRGPAAPAPTLREAALPMLTQGAAMIVAGALLRFAVKHVLARQLSNRGLPGLQRQRGASGGMVVEELLYYRRVRRGT
ncbi:MAG TPA: hypothetical protein VKV26_11305 [Dehalococcoidia bacterium]|nr:hypothetical protein [Dehalococcoidia bacterium]